MNLTTHPICLPGRLIILRDWQLKDVATYVSWQSPEHRWHQLDGPYYPKPRLEDLTRIGEQLQEDIREADWPEPRQRLVIADSATDALCGVVTWYWESEETYWLLAGISIFDPDAWGKGIGYQALGLWTQYLFDTMPHVVRTDLRTWSGNIGMMRLAAKLGYREEARFRNARIVDGTYYDGMGYGALQDEWNAISPEGFASKVSNEI